MYYSAQQGVQYSRYDQLRSFIAELTEHNWLPFGVGVIMTFWVALLISGLHQTISQPTKVPDTTQVGSSSRTLGVTNAAAMNNDQTGTSASSAGIASTTNMNDMNSVTNQAMVSSQSTAKPGTSSSPSSSSAGSSSSSSDTPGTGGDSGSNNSSSSSSPTLPVISTPITGPVDTSPVTDPVTDPITGGGNSGGSSDGNDGTGLPVTTQLQVDTPVAGATVTTQL